LDSLDNQGSLQADTRLSVGVNHISNAGTLTSGNELSILGDILSNSGSLNGHVLTLIFVRRWKTVHPGGWSRTTP
jgi:hypothetical protein